MGAPALWTPRSAARGNFDDLILPKPGMLRQRQDDPDYNSGPVVLSFKPASLRVTPGEIDKQWTWQEELAFAAEMEEEYRRTGVRRIGGAAAGAWTLTNEGRTKFLDGTFAVGTDTFKMGLLLSSSNIGATSTTYAGVTNEVATANGYTQGGVTVTLSLSGTTTVTLAFTQAQWTASGGSITARFALCWENAGRVVAYALCDSTPADVTATNGNTFTIAAGNIFTLA